MNKQKTQNFEVCVFRFPFLTMRNELGAKVQTIFQYAIYVFVKKR